MDFLEIRRKAKERAAGASPAAEAPPAPIDDAAALPGLHRLPDEPPEERAEHREARHEIDVAPGSTPVWPGEDRGIVEELRDELTSLAAAAAPRTGREPPAPEADPLAEFFFDAGEAAPALAEPGAATSARKPAREAVEERREYLSFLLGVEEYAVDIANVREVLKAPLVTEVPRAPTHVLGVIMVRGEVIAVFDPRRRLGLPPDAEPRASRVVVCDSGEGPIGLLVDAVSQVVHLGPGDVEPRPQGIGGVSAEYIAGIGRAAGRMFILLDLATVLRGAKEALA